VKEGGKSALWRLAQAIFPVPYFASERSFAQYRLPEDVRSIVSFGPQPNTLIIVSASGSFYTAAFDEHKGGMCQQLSYCKFLELDHDD
jgi:hypothetical protein